MSFVFGVAVFSIAGGVAIHSLLQDLTTLLGRIRLMMSTTCSSSDAMAP